MYFFISELFERPDYFFMVSLAVIFSICLHEYCHAHVALMEGDSTAADRGHLTLNPLKQMGVISLIMFCIIGIAWGAVPVDPRNFRGRWSGLKISLAGPCANISLLAFSWVAFGFLAGRGDSPLLQFILIMGVYNFVLAALNLMPVPGLDGWNILLSFYPDLGMNSSEAQKGIMAFVIFAMIMFIQHFFKAGAYVMSLAPKALS